MGRGASFGRSRPRCERHRGVLLHDGENRIEPAATRSRGSLVKMACGTKLVVVLVAMLGPAVLATSVEAQWVEAPGQGWADLTVYYLDTREQFDFDTRVRDFFADGHAVTVSAFLTLAVGILPGVDGWLQVPYHRLQFEDAGDSFLRSGIGDSNFYLRIQPLRYLGSDFPVAVRVGVKVPVGDFSVDVDVIPLGDGQTDWEVMTEIGHSFYPFPAYVNGWVGYRWRGPNNQARRDFGDEGFFLAQVGANYGEFGFQFLVEGMGSVTIPVIEGIPLRNAERSILQVTPKVNYAIGPGSFSVGARISLRGKNLPAGTSLVLGYFSRLSL